MSREKKKGSLVPAMTDKAWIQGLTVEKLKGELKQRGLPSTGLKAVLLERLLGAIDQDEATPSQEAGPAIERTSGENDDEPAVAPLEAAPAKEEARAAGQLEEEAAPAPTAVPAEEPQPVEKGGSSEAEPLYETKSVRDLLAEDDDEDDPVPDHAEAGHPMETDHPELAADHPEPAAHRPESAAHRVEPDADRRPLADGQDVPAVATQPAHTSRMAEEAPAIHEPKRKRAPIQFQPPERKNTLTALEVPREAEPAVVQQPPSGEAAAQGEPLAKRLKVDAKPHAMAKAGSKDSEEEAEAGTAPTRFLYIGGLSRPFTDAALRQLLSESGTVLDLWLAPLKTHAVVTFENGEQAEATRQATQGLKWPACSHKLLQPRFISEAEAEREKSGRAASSPSAAAGAAVRGGGIIAAIKASQAVPRAAGIAAAAAAAAADAASATVAPTPRGQPAASLRDSGSEPVANGGGGGNVAKAAVAEPAATAAAPTVEEEQTILLDDLFRKTVARPPLYYLPLSEVQVAARRTARPATVPGAP